MHLIREKPFSFIIGQKQTRLLIPAHASRESARGGSGIFSPGDTVRFLRMSDDSFNVAIDTESNRLVYVDSGRMFCYVPPDIMEAYNIGECKRYLAFAHDDELIIKVICEQEKRMKLKIVPEKETITDLVKRSGLEDSKQVILIEEFASYEELATTWQNKADEIVVTDAGQTAEMQLARTGRLLMKEKRVAIEKRRKELKSQSLLEGKAIDSIAKALTALIKPIEKHFDAQEHFIDIEAQKVADRIRAEMVAKVESDRIEREEAERVEQERIKAENAKLKADAEAAEKVRVEKERDRVAAEKQAADEKRAIEEQAAWDRVAAETERTRIADELAAKDRAIVAEREKREAEKHIAERNANIERKRVADEKIAAEKKAADEKRKLEEKAAREKAEAEAEKQRLIDESAEREAQARREAEKKERAAQLEREEAAEKLRKLEAEKVAAELARKESEVVCPHCQHRFVPGDAS